MTTMTGLPARLLRLALPAAAFLLAHSATAAQAQESASFGAAGGPCAGAIAAAETSQAIPAHLLRAISLAESGRWDPHDQASVAWPWTVTARGTGQFFPTKEAAVNAVRALQESGVRNIDVGCLQINLRYHPQAFADLETAFDPAANAAYAARFLAALNHQTGSWTAAARYHSATPKFARPYRARVIRLWNESRGGAAAAHRARVREAYLARRAARRYRATPTLPSRPQL